MRLKLSSSRLGSIAFVAAASALIGSQMVHPSKRVIEALVGLLFVYLFANFSNINALWFLLIIYPVPFGISVGNSTFIFIIVMFIIYLLRVSAHRSIFRGDRQFNLPIVLLVMSCIISFYNQDTSGNLMRFALIYTINFLAAVLFFYMIINFVDDEAKLKKTIAVSIFTCGLVITFTILELLFPGRELIPNWLYTEHKIALIMKGQRMGGPFHDFELNAEFFAMNVPIILLMIVRSRRLLTRSIYTILLVTNLFMLFATMTRGAFISLVIGMIYMAYACRKDLNFVRFASLIIIAVVLVFALDMIVAQHTISGSLLTRLVQENKYVHGIPYNRYWAWVGAVNRAREHLIIGHGPGWDFSRGLKLEFWPHNAYLFYLDIGGLFGLFGFVFLLVRLVKASFVSWKSSLARSPLPEAFMKVLNVSLVIFIIDQMKIDYLRNTIYLYFVWFFFGLIAATRNIILEKERTRLASSPSR